MSKKTRWFKPGTKPARVGVYECTRGIFYCKEVVLFQHWNGKDWGFCSKKSDGAFDMRRFKSRQQSPTWRGLSEKPA